MAISSTDTLAEQPARPKAKKVGPSLSRNQACRTCRSRKVRCDAAKPSCAACRRSANAQGKDVSKLVCEYDEEPPILPSLPHSARSESADEPSAKRARTSPPTQQSIDSLQRQISDLQNRVNGPPAPDAAAVFPGDWLAQASMGNGGWPPYADLYSNSFAPHQQTGSTPVTLAAVFPEPRNYSIQPAAWAGGVPLDTSLPAGTSLASVYGAPTAQVIGSERSKQSFPGQPASRQDMYPGSLANPLPFTEADTALKVDAGMDGTLNTNQNSFQVPSAPLAGNISPVVAGINVAEKGPAESTPPLTGDGSASGPSPFDGSELFALWYPNWPTSLPKPKLVFDLCEIYFSKDIVGRPIINRERFLANLALPPNHHLFPHVALIHAVLATAVKFVEDDALGLSKESYWRSEASPTDYHAAIAKQNIDAAIVKGDKLLSIAQAIVLLCFYSYSGARFVQVWLECSLATRICSPLGLNHLEGHIDIIASGVYDEIGEDAFHRKLESDGSRGPTTEEEKVEQAHVAWTAFMCDRAASACTGWASSLAEEDMSTLLPKAVIQPGPVQPITEEEMTHLSLSSPTFFTSNDSPLIDAVSLQYKAMVLLGRVCAYLRTAAWPIGSDLVKTARFLGKGGKPALSDVSNSPDFKRLDALIVAFRMSFPKKYKNILGLEPGAMAETALITAHVVPHAATILLHESFCLQVDDVSMRRCITSARAILGIIYLLWNSKADIGLLQPFITFTYATAGRTLVRELAFRLEAEDELAAATLMQEINVIITVLSTHADRSPLGTVVANSLRDLLNKPHICHPRKNGGAAMIDACGTASVAFGTAKPRESGSASTSQGPLTPGEMFSGLLWELEQPEIEINQSQNYKTLESDLRAVLGPSFDQVLHS